MSEKEFMSSLKNLTKIKECNENKLEPRIDRKKMEVLTVNLKKNMTVENKKWSVLECQSVHTT